MPKGAGDSRYHLSIRPPDEQTGNTLRHIFETVLQKVIPMRLIHRLASVIFIVLSCSSCTMERQKTEAALDEIDSLLETDPSHALEAADQIRTEELATRRERARYALLYSAALDKNRIDICSDSIIHPATAYYIRKGSDRERSMTYYYTGRICENAHDSEKAMHWMTMAEKSVESRTYLHALIISCKGRLYHSSCYHMAAAENFRMAAEIFRETGHDDKYVSNKLREATCLLMAGKSEDAERIADGMMVLQMKSKQLNYPALLNIYDITRPECTLVLLERYMEEAESPDKVDWLTVSRIYLSNRMPEKAMQALQRCTDTGAAYHYRLAQANEMSGKYKEAVESYKIYIGQSGLIGDGIIDQDTRFVEERVRHTDIYEKVRMRNIILWLSIAAAAITLALAVFIILAIRRQLEFREQEKEILKIQLDGLITEREELSRLHMADEEVRQIIAERLAIIDGFVMSEALQDNIFEKQATGALKRIIADREKFISQTRLIFSQSHPEFISSLESAGLTEREIEHCCLYAIGMNGKMVMSFTNLKRHYHIGSDIRRKLGLTEHDTNLSIYIRRLLQKDEQ